MTLVIGIPIYYSEYMDFWHLFNLEELFMTGVGTIGLYGFAFKKSIGSTHIWKISFLLILLLDIAVPFVEFVLDLNESIDSFDYGLAIFLCTTIVLMVPYYIALFKYGWSSTELSV